MTDFFDRLENELVAAARRRAPGRARFIRLRSHGWGRRPLLVALAALTLAAVPTVGAVSGLWDESPPEPGGDGVGGAVVPDLAERPCTGPVPPAPPASDDPPPAELLDLLGTLRRPRAAGDALPHGQGLDMAAGVNPDAVRLARTDPDGRRWYLVPARNIRHQPPVPDTPECERFRQPAPEPVAGVCLVETGPSGGGGTCQSARQIRDGFSQLSADHIPGERPGTAHVAGIVPDGVTHVVLEFSRGPQRRVVAEVRGNVFSASFNGSAAGRPRTFWRTAGGLREVAKESPPTARGRRAQARSQARDRDAGPRPSVYPPAGGAETIFAVRLRRPERDAAFVITVRGPGGERCGRSTVERTGAVPGRNGLIRVYYQPRQFGRAAWCPGTYRGEVELDPRGAEGLRRRGGRRTIGSFAFTVRQPR